jgi:hypothetical protein
MTVESGAGAPSGLQLDLANVLIRLDTLREEHYEGNELMTEYLVDLIMRDDVPRLRAYLWPTTVAWAVRELGLRPLLIPAPTRRLGGSGRHRAPPRWLRAVAARDGAQ